MKLRMFAVLVTAILLVSTGSWAAVLVVSVTDYSELTQLSAEERAVCKPEIGDIISVRPDDWTADDTRFGLGECKNNPPRVGGTVVCLDVTGLPKAQVQDAGYLMPVMSTTDPTRIVRFRRFRLDLDRIPGATRYQLFDDGYGTLALADLEDCLIDKEAIR